MEQFQGNMLGLHQIINNLPSQFIELQLPKNIIIWIYRVKYVKNWCYACFLRNLLQLLSTPHGCRSLSGPGGFSLITVPHDHQLQFFYDFFLGIRTEIPFNFVNQVNIASSVSSYSGPSSDSFASNLSRKSSLSACLLLFFAVQLP